MPTNQVLVRRMAIIATGLFVEVETTSFERHLASVLPIIQLQTQPEKYEQVWKLRILVTHVTKP